VPQLVVRLEEVGLVLGTNSNACILYADLRHKLVVFLSDQPTDQRHAPQNPRRARPKGRVPRKLAGVTQKVMDGLVIQSVRSELSEVRSVRESIQ
jgi:hypothetical protein